MKITSHSLKTTVLTAVGEHGASSEVKQLLGYHIVKGDSTALNCNRDNLAIPMEVLEQVIYDVRTGAFIPDNPRATRFPERTGSAKINFVDLMESSTGMSFVGLVELFKASLHGHHISSVDGSPVVPAVVAVVVVVVVVAATLNDFFSKNFH